MKKAALQLLHDRRLWAMTALAVFIAIVPPGEGNAGYQAPTVDSLEYYRINTINYINIQDSIIKNL